MGDETLRFCAQSFGGQRVVLYEDECFRSDVTGGGPCHGVQVGVGQEACGDEEVKEEPGKAQGSTHAGWQALEVSEGVSSRVFRVV